METSLKPETVLKKTSNRRVKTKRMPILHENSESSNHAGVTILNSKHNELDSPTVNVNKISPLKKLDSSGIVSSTPNMNNSVENIDPCGIIMDGSQIYAAAVNDRKLFMDSANGDLDKYKHCVKIESNSQRDVWVGATARYSTIKFYICVRNIDDSMNTFFMNSNDKQKFESALMSFAQTGDPNLLSQSDELVHTSLEYSNVDGDLVMNEVLNPTKKIIFDNAMIYSYTEKKWVLERFIEYLLKKRDMIHYCQHIFTIFANYDKTNVTKNDFIDKFENSKPPNYIFTSTEMWNFFNKKFLGN